MAPRTPSASWLQSEGAHPEEQRQLQRVEVAERRAELAVGDVAEQGVQVGDLLVGVGETPLGRTLTHPKLISMLRTAQRPVALQFVREAVEAVAQSRMRGVSWRARTAARTLRDESLKCAVGPPGRWINQSEFTALWSSETTIRSVKPFEAAISQICLISYPLRL